MTDLISAPAKARRYDPVMPVRRWWSRFVTADVDHQRVLAKIMEESRWDGRFAFMTTMSAGIAVLGLLLSSPAVVIGAMLTLKGVIIAAGVNAVAPRMLASRLQHQLGQLVRVQLDPQREELRQARIRE